MRPVVSGLFPIAFGMSSILRGSAAFSVPGIIFVGVQEGLEVGGFGALVGREVAGRSFIVSPIAVSEDLVRPVDLDDAAVGEIVISWLVRFRVGGPGAT